MRAVMQGRGFMGLQGRERGRGLKAVLLITTALMLVPGAALAQSSGRDAAVRIDRGAFRTAALDFGIAGGELGPALRQWASTTGFKLLVSTDALKGQRTAGLSGRFTADAALRGLLASTPLSYELTGQRSVTIYNPNAALNANAQSIQLDTINVDGRPNDVAGFVARRSSAGSKTDTPILETPQSISVVTREQMDARAVSSVVEALQYVPGVFTHPGGKDPRYDNVAMRGFSANGFGQYRDGLRDLGDSSYFSLYRNETYGLERVDVARGPSSVLYGQNAPGGVIDVISKRPTAEPIREIMAQYATGDRFQGGFDLAGAADKDGKLLYRLVGLARDSDAQIKYFSQFVKDDRLFLAPSFTWQPTPDTKLTVLADLQRDATGNAFPVTKAIVQGGKAVNAFATPLFLGDPSFNKFDHEQYRIGYQFEHRFNDALTFKQNLRYGQVDLDYRYLTGNQINNIATVARVARLVDEQVTSFTVDNQMLANVNTGPIQHKLLAGIDHQRFHLDHVTLGGGAPSLNMSNPIYWQPVAMPTTRLADVDQHAQQLGFYVQDQAKWNNFVLTLGGRYDWATLESQDRRPAFRSKTTTEDEAFTKRVGLTYLFDSGFAPYVSYTDSFLPNPTLDAQSRPFKPTTAQQYEAGVKYQMPNQNVLVTLAVYDLTQQNVLTQDPNNLNFKLQTGEVHSRGFEAQATATLMAGLNLVASYTWQDLEVTKTSAPTELGKVPVLTPEHLASAFLDYTFQNGALEGFGFGGGVRYAGETFMDPINSVRNPAYTVFDAAVHYKHKSGIRAALNVSNLFDKSMAACTLTGGCQWISPRVVTGTLTYRW